MTAVAGHVHSAHIPHASGDHFSHEASNQSKHIASVATAIVHIHTDEIQLLLIQSTKDKKWSLLSGNTTKEISDETHGGYTKAEAAGLFERHRITVKAGDDVTIKVLEETTPHKLGEVAKKVNSWNDMIKQKYPNDRNDAERNPIFAAYLVEKLDKFCAQLTKLQAIKDQKIIDEEFALAREVGKERLTLEDKQNLTTKLKRELTPIENHVLQKSEELFKAPLHADGLEIESSLGRDLHLVLDAAEKRQLENIQDATSGILSVDGVEFKGAAK